MKIKRWQLIVIIIATIVVMIGSIFIGINLFSDNNEANKQTNYLADTSSSKVVKEMRGEVPVPLGYNYVSGDKNTGLIVQDETTNNKYMWIPYSEVKEDANVDNGTYSKESFVNDGAGYGLAQWTYSSRKKALYEYAKEKYN